MEFNVSSAELLKGLIDVSKAIPAKSALPILENFLFVLKADKLEITASDQETTLRTSVTVDNTRSEGSIAVPAKHILDLLKALPDQPITIKTSSDSSFECIWGNGNSSLPYFPATDFPEIKGASESAQTITFPAKALLEGISGTIYATADDEMRPAMNGIFFDIDTASTTLVASDSHKLICYTTTEPKVEIKASFILHKKAAAVLKSIIDKVEEDIEVAFDESTVVFKFSQTMMVCRLVVGKYPRYREVIPQNNSNTLHHSIGMPSTATAIKPANCSTTLRSRRMRSNLPFTPLNGPLTISTGVPFVAAADGSSRYFTLSSFSVVTRMKSSISLSLTIIGSPELLSII